MKTANKRSNAFILNLTDEESELLKEIAEENDHPTSTQAYIIIRNYLKEVKRQNEAGVNIEYL